MHPTPTDLEGLVFGTLLRDEAEQVAQHVEQCPACEETVRLLEAKSDTYIDALRRPTESPEFVGESQCADFVRLVAGIGDELVTTSSTAGLRQSSAELGQLGQYRLLEKLGDGGMGAVYKAFHVKLKRVVALKVLPENRLQDQASIARFEREMEAAGQLQHLNIVAATDAGDHQGKHFLVMEYIAGHDVAQVVGKFGRLAVADACEIVRQAALGLACAHQHGLVHRDVKPSNLMLTADGTVKVLDLGLALLASPQSPGELTSTGQVMGTIDYIAPEQVADAHRVDVRADIYALGATLYRLLTGVAVYHGPRYETMLQKLRAIAHDPAPSILAERPELPQELAAIVHQLLELEPSARPQKADAVAGLLARFTAGANLSALLARAEAATSAKGDGSSVHSHLDGTLPANAPPAKPAAIIDAQIIGPRSLAHFPAKPSIRKPRLSPFKVALVVVVALMMLPLSCAGLALVAYYIMPFGASYDTAKSTAPADDSTVQPDPGTLSHIGYATGDVRYFEVTGKTGSFVWGSDIYTTDSSLATVAVHAGVLKPGEKGIVKVTILEGRDSYEASTRNGVTSLSYGRWSRSIRVETGEPPATSQKVHEYTGNFYDIHPVAGQVLRMRATGANLYSAWGTDVYTADSNLGTVSVHAGLLKVGETGVLRVAFLPGRESYTGSTRNGVTTSSWSHYSTSYRVYRDTPAESAGP